MSPSNAVDLDLSVVIGFKDWGQERLLVAIRTIQDAMRGIRGEVIVSDYGSRERGHTEAAVTAAGGRYVYTETNGVWSRARALNAGFAVARGSVLISTDADMAFSPESLARVCRMVQQDRSTAVVLQCRDLPDAFPAEALAGAIDWSELERVSRLRPRWGMGGMLAVDRTLYQRVRGFDERMEIYGGEDMDFADRLRRAGARIHWVEDPAVRMYHIWHAPSRAAADATPEGKAAIAENRRIYLEDKSIARNTVSWAFRPADAVPLVTVVIATHNRADFLADSINSVLTQTVQDFDLIVVDDGSTDHTREVVSSFDDDRIHYLRMDAPVGVAAARQRAAEVTRTLYTVIHDDDDLMLPWRIEAHLSVVQAGVNGSYGAWVDFDDETGALSLNAGKNSSLAAVLFSGKVYAHGTLMVETRLLRSVGYDPTLRSGSDYNLGVRLMRSGVTLVHTGEVHILRRLHHGQMTVLDPVVQKTSAVLSSFMARSPVPQEELQRFRTEGGAAKRATIRGTGDLDGLLRAYLPDHLVERVVVVRMPREPNAVVDDVVRRHTVLARWASTDSDRVEHDVVVEGLTWAEMAELRVAGAVVTPHTSDSDVAEHARATSPASLLFAELRSVAGADALLVEVARGTQVEDAARAVGGWVVGTREARVEAHEIVMVGVDAPDAVDWLAAMEHLGSIPGVVSVMAAREVDDETLRDFVQRTNDREDAVR